MDRLVRPRPGFWFLVCMMKMRVIAAGRCRSALHSALPVWFMRPLPPVDFERGEFLLELLSSSSRPAVLFCMPLFRASLGLCVLGHLGCPCPPRRNIEY